MKNLLIGLIAIGASMQLYAQEPKVEALKEVIIVATNYKYLDKVNAEDVAVPVQQLQRKVATYNIKDLDIYEDEYDFYDVSFVIPEGKVLASYDKDGKIIQTIEKFKNVALPNSVATSIAKRFPNWTVAKDVYLLNYTESKESAKKRYKITLENGDKRMKVKVDAEGNFL